MSKHGSSNKDAAVKRSNPEIGAAMINVKLYRRRRPDHQALRPSTSCELGLEFIVSRGRWGGSSSSRALQPAMLNVNPDFAALNPGYACISDAVRLAPHHGLYRIGATRCERMFAQPMMIERQATSVTPNLPEDSLQATDCHSLPFGAVGCVMREEEYRHRIDWLWNRAEEFQIFSKNILHHGSRAQVLRLAQAYANAACELEDVLERKLRCEREIGGRPYVGAVASRGDRVDD